MELSSHHYKAYGILIDSDIPLPPLKRSKPTTVDLIVKRGQFLPSQPLESTKVYRAGLNARFAQNGPNCLWLDWSPQISFMAVNGNELIVDTTHPDQDLVALFTLSEALGLILFQKDFFLLHGSAIQINTKGVVFLGEPGAGKSTTVAAFAQQGYSIISDDMVCIQLNEQGRPYLIPAFPQLKIWEDSVKGLQLHKENMIPVREGVNKFSWHDSIAFNEKAVPLEMIFVLNDASDIVTSIHGHPQSQVPIELLSYFPLPDGLLSGQVLKDYFKKSVTIAQTIPLYKMSRPGNFTKLYEFVIYLEKLIE